MLVHVRGPVGGTFPSDDPLELGAAPILFGGVRPRRFFVTPVTTFANQAAENACTTHGGSRLLENESRGHGKVRQVCRADLYSMSLFLDGNEGKNVGCTVSSMARAVERGVLSEYDRPWGSDDPTRRSPASWDARRMKGPKGVMLAVDVDAYKDAALVSGGVGIGHEVRGNYEPDAQGIVPPPKGTLDGYHFTAIEGWDDDLAGGCFLMAQSWVNWGIDHPLAAVDPRFAHLIGKRGYCWLPYAWVKTGSMFDPLWFKGSLEV